MPFSLAYEKQEQQQLTDYLELPQRLTLLLIQQALRLASLRLVTTVQSRALNTHLQAQNDEQLKAGRKDIAQRPRLQAVKPSQKPQEYRVQSKSTEVYGRH